jgi:hypothetical protein
MDETSEEPTDAPPPLGPIGRLTKDAIGYYEWVLEETGHVPGWPSQGNARLAVALAGAYFSA